MYSRIQKVLQNNDYSDIPVWLMRQAGRYMQEYHIVKNKFPDFISMCKNSKVPESQKIAAQTSVTM